MATGRLRDRLAAVGVVKCQLARDEIAIHSDDERLASGLALEVVFQSLDLASEVIPADGQKLNRRAVSRAGKSKREVVQRRAVQQNRDDQRWRPKRLQPARRGFAVRRDAALPHAWISRR